MDYKLPKIEADGAAVIDTPLATDTDLSTGVLTLLDEAGNDAGVIRIMDVINFNYDAYAAGTANENEIDFTASTIVANTMYSLSIKLPYALDFTGGGTETNAVYATRTYKVSVDATPTPTELAALFVARINGDLQAKFTASNVAGLMTIVADSAEGGAFIVNVSNITGTTVADSVPWVSPVGTVAEVQGYVNADLVVGAGYNRYVIHYRKAVRHNAVKGLEVIKPANFVYFIEAGSAAAVTLLTSILNGSYATTADYLGSPAV